MTFADPVAASDEGLVDSRYYQAARPRSIGERMIVAAREHIYADFLACCAPKAEYTLLDVGASDVLNDGANMLERKYPHRAQITAAGLGAAHAFRAAFPEVDYRQVVAGAPLPFADKSFDIAMSNAVLEHVGGTEQRRFFVGELARVARQVFLSIPHRWFPVEHHTALPFAHYWRPSFVLSCKAFGKSEWLDPANLCLLGARDLAAATPAGARMKIGRTGLPLGPFSSNLYLHIDG